MSLWEMPVTQNTPPPSGLAWNLPPLTFGAFQCKQHAFSSPFHLKFGVSRVNWTVVFLSTPPVSNLWNQSFFWDPSQTPGIPLPSDCPRTTSLSSYCGLKDRKRHVFDKRPWTFRGVYAQMGHFYLCTFSIESHLLVSQCAVWV